MTFQLINNLYIYIYIKSYFEMEKSKQFIKCCYAVGTGRLLYFNLNDNEITGVGIIFHGDLSGSRIIDLDRL